MFWGVAGAAGDHYGLLVFGLVLSIVLMATAATLISGWIKKYKWIAWVGLLAILIVATINIANNPTHAIHLYFFIHPEINVAAVAINTIDRTNPNTSSP